MGIEDKRRPDEALWQPFGRQNIKNVFLTLDQVMSGAHKELGFNSWKPIAEDFNETGYEAISKILAGVVADEWAEVFRWLRGEEYSIPEGRPWVVDSQKMLWVGGRVHPYNFQYLVDPRKLPASRREMSDRSRAIDLVSFFIGIVDLNNKREYARAEIVTSREDVPTRVLVYRQHLPDMTKKGYFHLKTLEDRSPLADIDTDGVTNEFF